ncbi:MAG: Dna2/Cas4 domain-containing protein [Romboutsia timonensis]
MARLKGLAKMVQNSQTNSVADSFVDDLIYTVEQYNKTDYTPSQSFKPSGIGGCERSLYYELSGVKPDVESNGYELAGICESGTDRHETLQQYVMGMKAYNVDCEWLDVGKYLHSKNITDPEVLDNKGFETKLFSHKYNMRFLCDGLIKYKGEVYILEIKTESTNKFNRHQEPWPSHIQQATCYAMNLQVYKVIFLYENRDTCSKKAYLVTVTPQMIQRVEDIIERTNKAVETNTIPPRCEDTSKCRYCKYKGQCKRDGV